MTESSYDEVAVTAEMDEVDRHPLSMLKDAVVIGKAVFTVYLTVMTALDW